MITAGLTGGIASGKSTVSACLQKAGAIIIDADGIARDAVRKGLPAWENIREEFGPEILLPDGEINRDALGNIIFRDREKRERLNAIVHPHVFAEMEKQRHRAEKKQPDAVVIQDIPLLFESGMQKEIFPVILVWIPEDLQQKRLMKRNLLSAEAALARIRSQIPAEEKKKQADILLDNSGSPEETEKKCLALFRFLQNADHCFFRTKHRRAKPSLCF